MTLTHTYKSSENIKNASPPRNYKILPNLYKLGIVEARNLDFSVTTVKCFATHSFENPETRKMELLRKKYGAFFKDITYFLRKKRNSIGWSFEK